MSSYIDKLNEFENKMIELTNANAALINDAWTAQNREVKTITVDGRPAVWVR